MSIEEIRAAQKEIHDTLKPESIQILKHMWRQRSQPHHPQQTSESHPKSTPSQQRTSSSDTVPADNQPQPRAPRGDNHPVSDLTFAPDLRSELLIPKEEQQSDEEETKKREWMIDAHQETPSQRQVDRFLQKAFENLGHLANMRFDFDGALLSPEDIENLPTHLGLHHHGSSPASAGYALQDILILMRSSVVNQRVLAIRMFKSVILRHRPQIQHVLVNSGILTSVFSYNTTDESFYAAPTSQSAYLELVEALVDREVDLQYCDSANVLYFGSNFYSPCYGATDNALLKTLADSDVILTLIGIARETVLRPEYRPVTERSLSVVFYLLTQVPHAASKVLKNSASLLALKAVATGPAESYPRAFMLCCHVLTQITISLGWRGGDELESIKRDVIDEAFIQKVSSKVIWLLDSDIQEITSSQGLVAKGVLRLIRGALTFQMGIEAFAAVAQMVCRLIRDNITSTEAFLTLEAYSHSLFVRATSQPDIKSKTEASGNMRTDKTDVVDENETSHRLSELIPTAISATAFFVDPTSQSHESKAAAGHFAATTFALLSYPIAKEYVVRILNVCSRSTTSLSRLASQSSVSAPKLRVLASLSHAGARLLSKIKLEKTFVRRELDILVPFSEKEKASRGDSSTVAAGNVISNACSEWIALYSRTGALKNAAELALKVIPCLADARVILDLMSRSVLNVKVLQTLAPDMTTVTAETCVKDLLPLTMAELQPLHQSETSQAETERATAYLSFVDICNLWVTNADTFQSFLHVFTAFSEAELIGGSEVLECMLRSPATEYSDSTFQVMFNLAQSCVDHNEPLISPSRNTAVSTLSTTLNSPLVESILSLCDYLSSRGPAPIVSAEGGNPEGGNPDFLASVLLSLMCGFDIDASLRASMWRRTVDDCGGALLYHNAVALRCGTIENEILHAEYGPMLGLFGVSISEGFLDGERCPEVIRNTILSLMDALLSVGKSPATIFELVAVRVRDRTLLKGRLLNMMMASPALSSRLEILSDFLSKPSC